VDSSPHTLERDAGKSRAIGQENTEKNVPARSLSNSAVVSRDGTRNRLMAPADQGIMTQEPIEREAQGERERELGRSFRPQDYPTPPKDGSSTASLDSSNTGSCSGLEISFTDVQLSTLITTTSFTTEFSDHDSDKPCSESDDSVEASEVSSADVAPISQTWDGTSPEEKLQACSELIRMIKVNAEVLEKSRFCESVTFLCLDQDRPIIAMLRSIKIADLLLLGVIMGAEETPDINLATLAGIFLNFSKKFLGDVVDYKNDSFEDGSSYLNVDFVILCLRILNLVLISHVYAHVGSFDHTITGDLTMQREFHVSKERCVSVETRPNDGQSIILTRRTLRCLSGFLGGEQVWVFHHLGKNVRRGDELFVSATPEDFANAWGPMWKIKKAGDPSVVMRYDLEHGSIVPANLTESLFHFSSATNMRLDEQRCHWISHSQLQNIQKVRDHDVSKQDGISHMTHQSRLLIGACEHTVRRNDVECYCNMAKAKSRFQFQGFIRDLHYVPTQSLRDSIQVGTSIGGASTGSISLSYRQTMKNLPGRTAQEAFYKRWVHREIRNWNCLFKYCGLEISICTRNSRRLRFVDLLAGATLRTALQSLPGYAQEPWRE
jgi:hypothetical protein